MSFRKPVLIAAFCTLAALCAPSPAAAASAEPHWQLSAISVPTSFARGTTGEIKGAEGPAYLFTATNIGAEATSGTVTFTDTLPAGLRPVSVSSPQSAACSIIAQTVTCTATEPVQPGIPRDYGIGVEVEGSAPATVTDEATISGGGGAPVSASVQTSIDSPPSPFDFLPGESGFNVPSGEADGSPATQAGSHPYQQTVTFGLPTNRPSGNPARSGQVLAGSPRDIEAALARGTLLDPAAIPVRCTEAELIGVQGCPAPSQVGTFAPHTVSVAISAAGALPLYNMVPPPGAASSFGVNVEGVGLYVHIIGGLRSDRNYELVGESHDILALGQHPLFGARIELWGDPSDPAHDRARGSCLEAGGKTSCPVNDVQTAMLTLPGSCPGTPASFSARADSWEEPGIFKEATYGSADLEGNPAPISGCNALEYQPTLSAVPTTNLADSPTGLDVDLHQPQDFDKERGATAELKNAIVSLPEGLVTNPSQADGLAACTQAEIGYLGEGHYSKEPQSCPEAAKLGTMEVASPLLAEYKNKGTEVITDLETGDPIPRPLEGSVYLAKPFENQFGSLLAIYLAVEDEESGIVAKLAGKVIPDSNTGQLTTVFEENPQLPLEDVKLHLFEGARASLVTPISCGAHTTTSTLTPWSAPEGVDAHPSDSFQTTQEPGGGSCPSSEGGAANKPAFSAGTTEPVAGAFSPFVLKLSREDGSQRLVGIDTLLPPGLSGKLAGIGQCSDSQIAQAKGREKPNLGALEKADPSCPSSSEVGTVDVSAGAGPTPFHTSGHAYLAGPYKGAPLSLAVIVPAVAGPFDLGAVVTRVALHVEPESAQIHAISDPFPKILEGIPLDLRSVSLTMGRPQFTLNPTSCDPMQIVGSAASALGSSVGLSNPFQVGGCSSLPFKPKLSLKLKGGTKRTGHPKLIASLKAKPGEANVAKAQVKLPPSAFLDQAHIRTVCTRVQFAANACPAGSIYGKAEATTPLLAYALSGNVYLRSSNHKLPDLVVALKGPDYQPIEIDLAGKTDSVKGSLRNTFEAVPDAPVTQFRLELFGGKRGLVVNSRNLCAHRYKAEVNLTGQNGKVFDTEPVVGTGCKSKRQHHHR